MLERGLTLRVVLLAQLVVGEHLIRLADFLELIVGVRVVPILVGMQLLRHLKIGFTNGAADASDSTPNASPSSDSLTEPDEPPLLPPEPSALIPCFSHHLLLRLAEQRSRVLL